MDQNFLVRIVNSDSQEILKTIAEGEGGEKAFADFEMDGAVVQYSVGKINLSYYNHNPKVGQNYEIQIFYLDDTGKEYLLRHGTKKFIKNGKVI